jgi:hypothetical protein
MEKFHKYWNAKIKDWAFDPVECFNNDIYNCIYRASKPSSSFKIEFLPEPYLGDMANNYAVIINKNPGPEIFDLQHYKVGQFIRDNKAHLDYESFAKKFPYLSGFRTSDGGTWWKHRFNWLRRLSFGKSDGVKRKPFALELCPWHSNQFSSGSLNFTPAYWDYLKELVIEPAEYANNNSELGVVTSVGGIFNQIYQSLGFTRLLQINRDNFRKYNLEWEIKPGKKPTMVEYILWQSPTNHYYLNFESGSRFNQVPPEKWNHVEEFIFSEIKGKQ